LLAETPKESIEEGKEKTANSVKFWKEEHEACVVPEDQRDLSAVLLESQPDHPQEE